MIATSPPLRRALYFGGIVYTVSGVSALIHGLRTGRVEWILTGCSWFAVGMAVSLLGDRRASVRTPRATLIWVCVILGVGGALGGALVIGRLALSPAS